MINQTESLRSKLPDVGTTIFTIMSRMANEHNAINLSQGFPDFNCPEELTDLVNYYLKKGFNQYAPMQGVPSLRYKISEKVKKLYGRKYNPETEITITAGATQAIYTVASAVINPGDEVILFEPAYDSYEPSVKINGGIPVFISLNQNDFSIDWDKVRGAITDKTRLIFLNSPHNPTGSVITESDIQNLEDITRHNDIFVLSDEVYEHIVFDGKRHFSIACSKELSKKAFVISSFGKTYHTTGWKIGYCLAPGYLMKEFRKIHQFMVFAVNTPIQHAYAEFMENESHYLSLNNFYENKRNILLRHLKNSRWKIKPASGTYFQLLDYSGITKLNDMEFTEELTIKAGVATIPLSPFYSDKKSDSLIRVCFAKKDEVLKEAADILSNI
ncbi:MAG TPA: methionine aminotransferase [Ignavibacteriaceae bacterium]|nr:methionine aminotransferase [Ignavibacteriaceae bacterium]